MFGLVERFIGAKMLEVSRDHWLGDQIALEALVRFTDEELKHQELFRRIERLARRGHARRLPLRAAAQRRRAVRARQVDLGRARADLPHRAVHAGALPREHRADADDCRELFKDVFLFHWKEESQHAILDELEWLREDAQARAVKQRDAAVDDLIALVGGVDGILQAQAAADAEYFLAHAAAGVRRRPSTRHGAGDGAGGLSLAVHRVGRAGPRFGKVLAGLVTPAQMERIQAALAGLQYSGLLA